MTRSNKRNPGNDMAAKNWEPFVFVTDTHGDQEDREAVKLCREFVEDAKPKHRIHGGDFADLRPLRKGAGAEERAERIEEDWMAAVRLLDWLRPQTVLMGNHDYRLYEALDSNCGMTATTAGKMLESFQGEACREPRTGGFLGKIGVKDYLPYHVQNGVFQLGNINFIHGYRSTKYPAAAHAENYGPSVICGHVHKYDVHIPRHFEGGMAMSAPTLARLDMRYLDKAVASLAHDNGWIYGVVNNRTGKWEAWCIRRQRGSNQWLDPRLRWI